MKEIQNEMKRGNTNTGCGRVSIYPHLQLHPALSSSSSSTLSSSLIASQPDKTLTFLMAIK